MNQVPLLSFVWGFFFIIVSMLWIKVDNLPPSWDQAQYLYASEVLHRSLTHEGFLPFLMNTTTVLATKAPLISILPVPLYLIFGSGFDNALLLNVIFGVIFFVFFFKLVQCFYEETTAFWSLVIVSSMPLFYGLTRYYFVEFGLTALVVLWLYFLKKWDLYRKDKYVFFLGTVFAFGMLLKFNFPLFVIGPVFVIIYSAKKESIKNLFNLKLASLFILPVVLIAAPWYLRNAMTLLWKAKRATDPELLGELYYGTAFSVSNIYNSLIDFINFAVSPYWLLVLIIFFVILKTRSGGFKFEFFFISWFIFPFLIFFFGPNKDYRLLLPLIPPVAVFISRLLYQSNLNFYQKAFVVFPAILIFLNSTPANSGLINEKITLGPVIFINKEIGDYVKPPHKDDWPIVDVLNVIKNDTDDHAIITLTTEDASLNINNLQYYSFLGKFPFTITSAAYLPKDTSEQLFTENIEKADYLITKKGGPDPSFDLNRFEGFTKKITNSGRWIRLSSTIYLPDGGRVVIWKKIP